MRKNRLAVAGLMSSLVAFGTATLPAQSAVFSNSAVVTDLNRSATFDPLTADGIDLTAYAEGTLSVTVADTSVQGLGVFQPGDARTSAYHHAGNNTSFVMIAGTDDALFRALDFFIGDGLFAVTTHLRWETYLNNILTDSGTELFVPKGSTVGWTDDTGFDELRVAASSASGAPGFGNLQSIALDDVRAQISPAAPIPVPAALPLFVTALAGLGLIARRRLSKT